MQKAWKIPTFFILYFILVLSVFSINAYANSELNNTTGAWVASNGLINNDYQHPSSLLSFIQISFFGLPLWVQIIFIPSILLSFVVLLNMPVIVGRLKNVLDNKKRQAILTYIMDNPGCTIADISDTQKINRGTVKYHIFQLELNGKVFTKHENKFARLFHKTSEFRDMERVVMPYLRNDTSKAILLVIMDTPGITNQDLSSKFNLDKSTVHWYLQKFNNDGIINFVKEGKFRKCFINTDAKLVMLRFMPA
jgi:predicted transcriptional regulator